MEPSNTRLIYRANTSLCRYIIVDVSANLKYDFSLAEPKVAVKGLEQDLPSGMQYDRTQINLTLTFVNSIHKPLIKYPTKGGGYCAAYNPNQSMLS